MITTVATCQMLFRKSKTPHRSCSVLDTTSPARIAPRRNNWSTLLKPLQDVLPSWIVIPSDLALVPTEYKLTVSFVILVMTLLWRPTGIFKGAST